MSVVLLLSTALALENGDKAPDFQLTSIDGQKYTLSSFVGKVVVLEWFNPGCPFVKYTYENKLTTAVADNNPDVVWLAINSSAPSKQGHGIEKNQQAKKEWNINFPILIDENGMTGKAYDAKTTPHMYVIDQTGVLVYQGALDDAPLGRGSKRIPYVENALDALKNGNPISVPKSKAYGCSVKYK
jgi:peroxiredoxin